MITVDHKNEIKSFTENLKLENALESISYDNFFNSVLTDKILLIHSFWLADSKFMNKASEANSLFVFGNETAIELKLKNFCGFINEKNQIGINILKSLIQIDEKQIALKKKLTNLNQSLDQLLDKNQSDLLNLKKIFEKNVPKRKENLKGLSFVAKYAAGERGGGEFFDTIKLNNQLLFLISSCSSYLASSCIMTLFSDLRKETELDDSKVLLFTEKVSQELKSFASEDTNLESNMIVALVDLKSLNISGYIFGEFNIISTNNKNLSRGNLLDINSENIKQAYYKMKLTRDERLLLVSPGFVRNWERIKSTTTINELVISNKINISDVLDELFFQIKKDSDEMFLHRDASAIMLEVDHNVILKI
jgi:hypothetical protein